MERLGELGVTGLAEESSVVMLKVGFEPIISWSGTIILPAELLPLLIFQMS